MGCQLLFLLCVSMYCIYPQTKNGKSIENASLRSHYPALDNTTVNTTSYLGEAPTVFKIYQRIVATAFHAVASAAKTWHCNNVMGQADHNGGGHLGVHLVLHLGMPGLWIGFQELSR